ncbi:MAG: acyl-CoA thioesterase [Bacteroidaceae bacterium]|jgi:acyl-CoA thioester hydrolase|nr:acyl-CoA thioesterase [Bacteroidaceae bacterium]
MTEKYTYSIEMKVRDYECDIQGVVNNANYQHYMEHARHEFLESIGGSFSLLHEQGVDLMVSKITIEYKRPLRGGDKFVVCINMERRGAKLVFVQDIYNKADGVLSAKGVIDVVCLKNGRLTRGEVFDDMFKDYFQIKND